MSIFPKDYTVPTTGGGFMTFEDYNKVRILKAPVIGTEYWVELPDGSRKPKRVRVGVNVEVGEVALNKYGGLSISHWHGYAVYNYEEKKVQVMNVTQKSIQSALRNLDSNSDWGEPTKYDIEIRRQDDGKGYTVTPLPPKELSKEIKEIIENTRIYLENLYSSVNYPYGGNPFEEQMDKIDVASLLEDDDIKLPF